jgi:hypothetical protein
MLAIVLINNSTLDANTLASAKLELIRDAEVRALDQNKTVSESPFNHSTLGDDEAIHRQDTKGIQVP